jgi:hypothetical protein
LGAAFTGIVATAALTAGCESSSNVTSGPSLVKCEVALAASPSPMEPGGGVSRVTVTTQPECTWTAASGVNWISNVAPASGQGSAELTVSVAANPLSASRQGDVVVNEVRVPILQAASPCRVDIQPRSRDVSAAGGPGTVTVTAASGCTWTATSQASWLTLTQPFSGEGNGTLGFIVAANTAGERRATVSVADQTFSVTQAEAGGTAPCQYSIDPASSSVVAAGRTGVSVAVSTSAGCAWTSISNVPWIAITAGASQQGSGSATLNVNANTGAARVGTATIAGHTFTVSQTALNCTYTIAPTTQSAPAAGGAGQPVSVSTTSTCTWTATSNAAWLTIASGASGTGNGSVGFSASANTGVARSGTLTIAGQTFTVNQAGGCTYSISPTSQSAPAAGGAGSPNISVTSGSGCPWTAASNAAWLTISSGASGTSNGSVGYSVAANTSVARSGTLTVAGQTFTVNQATGCAYAISPTSHSAAAAGGAGPNISVTAGGGCAWTAASNASSWLTISSGASGSGNGMVGFSVAATPGPARSGTLTVAGQTFTVNQQACTYVIAPTSQSVNRQGGGAVPISVTTAAHCVWTASSNASWITVSPGAGATGSGTVGFTVATLPGNVARSGTITAAGQTATINQSGN